MPIRYIKQQKPQPGVPGGGDRKYYGAIHYEDEVTIDELVKSIEKSSSLSESDIRGVIFALVSEISSALSDSHIVRLDVLGSFYPAIKSKGVEREDEFVANRDIYKVGVNYRPGKRIIQAMENAGFEKVNKRS